jgi:hypothetical protein
MAAPVAARRKLAVAAAVVRTVRVRGSLRTVAQAQVQQTNVPATSPATQPRQHNALRIALPHAPSMRPLVRRQPL